MPNVAQPSSSGASPSRASSSGASRSPEQAHDALGAPILSSELSSALHATPVQFLTRDFRLTTGAPASLEEVSRTPHVLRGVIEQVTDLARRVSAGQVQTGERQSTMHSAPAFLPHEKIRTVLGEYASSFMIEARVSRVQIEALVKGLRVLGYDAVGIEMPSPADGESSVEYALLAVRDGFKGLTHLRDSLSTLAMPAPNVEVDIGTEGAARIEDKIPGPAAVVPPRAVDAGPNG